VTIEANKNTQKYELMQHHQLYKHLIVLRIMHIHHKQKAEYRNNISYNFCYKNVLKKVIYVMPNGAHAI